MRFYCSLAANKWQLKNPSTDRNLNTCFFALATNYAHQSLGRGSKVANSSQCLRGKIEVISFVTDQRSFSSIEYEFLHDFCSKLLEMK